MGWVAYNMNKRHARGLWCLKYDKKASMTNQSSGIGTWQDLRIGRLRRLQLDQSGKVFFRPGGWSGWWELEEDSLAKTTKGPRSKSFSLTNRIAKSSHEINMEGSLSLFYFFFIFLCFSFFMF